MLLVVYLHLNQEQVRYEVQTQIPIRRENAC